MIQQVEITLTPKSRGFHLVTSERLRQLPKLPKTGIINTCYQRPPEHGNVVGHLLL